MTENSPHVILISSSKSSANFAVAQAIVKGLLEDCVIHHVFFSEKEEEYERDSYYIPHPVFNLRKRRYNHILSKLRINFLKRIYQSLFYHITNLSDNFVRTRIEKNGLLVVNSIIRKHSDILVIATNNPIYAQKILIKSSIENPTVLHIPLWLDPYLMRYDKINFLWKSCASYLEKKLFSKSDTIFSLPETFNGNPNIKLYENKHVTFEIPFIKNIEVQTRNKDVYFAGSFVQNLREPNFAFRLLLQVLPDIDAEIRFIFHINNPDNYRIIENQSNHRILINPFISREELEKKLSQCYMLINIGNINSFQMPSKVVEYISFKKPIIYFQHDFDDPSLRYYDLYPDVCKLKEEDDISISKKKLLSFFSKKHEIIQYEDLMRIPLFERSTAEYVAKQISKKYDTNFKTDMI